MGETSAPRIPMVFGIVRFAMELLAWGGLCWWGWKTAGGGVAGGLLGGVLLIGACAIWGVFSVRGDTSRNPEPVIAVPGWIRLIIELGTFGLASWALWSVDLRWLAETLLTFTGLTYIVMYDRTLWLLRQKG